MARYICWNGAIPTTGAQVPVTLTNAQKTQLQVTAAATGQLSLIEWGFSFGTAASLQAAVQVELLTTAGIAGTGMTAVVPTKYDRPNDVASAATAGFSPSAEGSIVTVRMLDSRQVTPLGDWFRQIPLHERPVVDVSQVVRIRTNTPSLSSFPIFLCYLIWAEAD